MKANMVEDRQKIEPKRCEITGVGDTKIVANGEACVRIEFWSRMFEVCGLVGDNESIEYDIILGIDFLRRYAFKICMDLRRISFECDDGSRMTVVLDNENKLMKGSVERVPVVCVADVCCKEGDLDLIEAKIQTPDYCKGMFLFEGVDKNIETLDGVFDWQTGGVSVFGKVGNAKQKVTVKKDEIIGYAYSMVVTEDGVEDPSAWTKERLKKEVKLGDQLSEEQKERVWTILMDLRGALSENESDIGSARVEPHKIELTDSTPIWQKVRSFSQPINDEINRQCQELLLSDIIEYSNSSWSSPIVPVRKGDGSLRLCVEVDYRRLKTLSLFISIM